MLNYNSYYNYANVKDLNVIIHMINFYDKKMPLTCFVAEVYLTEISTKFEKCLHVSKFGFSCSKDTLTSCTPLKYTVQES